MEVQPKLPPCEALLAREDLHSRTAVMPGFAVCKVVC